MRRTLLGAAAAAALATATGLAFAQEKQQDQQAPASQRMENRPNKVPSQGQMKEKRGGQSAQTQAQTPMPQPGENEKAGEPGQPAKPSMKSEGAGTAVQGEQPQGAERRANQAQSETPNRAEDKKGAQAQERSGPAEKGAQAQERNGKADKGMQAQEPKAQSGAISNRQGAAQTGQSERRMQAQEPNTQSGATPNRGGATQPRAQTGENERKTGQGAAGSANVKAMGNAHLSHERAASIAHTLMATASPQNVNVDVSIGADLPGELDVRPLPPAVIALVPEYRGYDYVVVHDEIVIVEPSTRRVVEIIHQGGPSEGMAAPAERINLTADQQRKLFDTVRREHLPETAFPQELDDGVTVPAEITLEPVPHQVVVEIPMIERYRLFMANDRLVLVDPDTREVVDVIR
jgi:hypothetical protein